MKRLTTAALAVLTVLVMVFSLTACGGKAVTLTVHDKDAKTEVEANVGMTVSQVLEKAEIKLGEKDETEPAKDEKIAEDTKEITVKRYAKVTVKLGDESREIEMTGGTVADAIKKSGLNTDGCEPDVDKDKYLEDGMVINMVKGTKVTLTVDGKTNDVATKAKTVEDFLKEQKVTLGADDEVSEKLTAEIKDGMKIVVKRVEYKTEEKTEKIEYKTVEKESDSLEAGKEEVTQEGKDGEKTVTYKVKYVDGKEDSREKVEEKVTKEAVDKVVTRGRSSPRARPLSARRTSPIATVRVTATTRSTTPTVPLSTSNINNHQAGSFLSAFVLHFFAFMVSWFQIDFQAVIL